jgi:hypothetical protein
MIYAFVGFLILAFVLLSDGPHDPGDDNDFNDPLYA